jgi:cytochrome P450 family 12
MYKALNKEFGDIVKTPGMFGKSSSVCIFNAEDMETVFRNDGLHPNRRSIQTLEYYRNKIRTDIYGEYGSVFTDQGERWYKMRKNMAPVMLKPQILKQYIPDIDALTSEFVQK